MPTMHDGGVEIGMFGKKGQDEAKNSPNRGLKRWRQRRADRDHVQEEKLNFTIPLLAMFLSIIPVVGIGLMLMVWCFWASRNSDKIGRKLNRAFGIYKESEYSDDTREDLR